MSHIMTHCIFFVRPLPVRTKALSSDIDNLEFSLSKRDVRGNKCEMLYSSSLLEWAAPAAAVHLIVPPLLLSSAAEGDSPGQLKKRRNLQHTIKPGGCDSCVGVFNFCLHQGFFSLAPLTLQHLCVVAGVFFLMCVLIFFMVPGWVGGRGSSIVCVHAYRAHWHV